jgi:hypothetical protein
MVRVTGGGVVPAPLTKPVQPVRNAAEKLTVNRAAAHTHPLALFFTVLASSGLDQLVSWGGGVGGPAEMAAQCCPILARRIMKLNVYHYYWHVVQIWCKVKVPSTLRAYCPTARN